MILRTMMIVPVCFERVCSSGVRVDCLPRLLVVLHSYYSVLLGAALKLVLTNSNVIQCFKSRVFDVLKQWKLNT